MGLEDGAEAQRPSSAPADPGRRTNLPTGTVTFLFTDIEGSTRLRRAARAPATPRVLERHQALLRGAFVAHGGVEVGTEGDSFFVVFPSAPRGGRGRRRAQRALAATVAGDGGDVRVRMGLHTGEATLGGDDYVGLDVHRAARIASAAHGGQVLLSGATRGARRGALPPGVIRARSRRARLKDLDDPERLVQLVIDGPAGRLPAAAHARRRRRTCRRRSRRFVGREREVAEVRAAARRRPGC